MSTRCIFAALAAPVGGRAAEPVGDERAEIEARRRAAAELKARYPIRGVPLTELDKVIEPVPCRRTRERKGGAS
jgi:hypothetical protein